MSEDQVATTLMDVGRQRFDEDAFLCGSDVECFDILITFGSGVYGGGPRNSAKALMLGKNADELIRGSLKGSASYRAELGQETYAEIIRLSQGSGPRAQAAKQMKKLIEQSERLLSNVRGK